MGRHAPVLAGRIPDSTVREVPDAGHAYPLDNPDFFNSTVRGFMTDRDPVEPV